MFMKMKQNKCRKLPLNKLQGPRYPIRPQGKKASKRKWSASKNDYAKYMEELARQGELTLTREMAKFEADKAREEVKVAAVEREFQANERERERESYLGKKGKRLEKKEGLNEIVTL
ncbi:hypothetical protein ACFX11_013071 [Malus domestica]